MTLGFRIKFFFNKRVTLTTLKWDIKALIKGYRKKKYAIPYGSPIDMQGKQHIHIYPNIQCNLDCYFCQNKFYVNKLPNFKKVSFVDWAEWLNRMYNFHHIDINGGEPLYYPQMVDLLNKLDNHNIVLYTNLPKDRVDILGRIRKGNNITLNVSYHPLEEKRDIAEFVADYKKIPKHLNPSLHVINVPEISYKNIRAAFVMRGVFIEGLDAIVPTKYNKIKNNFKTVMCKSDMDCIAPDLTVYPCTGLMLRKINPVHISEYEFSNKHKPCDYYGLCGVCTSQRDII